jgi:hypothetical protein
MWRCFSDRLAWKSGWQQTAGNSSGWEKASGRAAYTLLDPQRNINNWKQLKPDSRFRQQMSDTKNMRYALYSKYILCWSNGMNGHAEGVTAAADAAARIRRMVRWFSWSGCSFQEYCRKLRELMICSRKEERKAWWTFPGQKRGGRTDDLVKSSFSKAEIRNLLYSIWVWVRETVRM